MAAPELDTNQWYSLYVNDDKDSSLLGTVLYDHGGSTGAVFFNKTDFSIPNQRWQIFPINSTTYILRSQRTGANGFIGSTAVDAKGIVAPQMLRGDVADDSVFWQFGNWGDGTWYMWNSANGTGYHMEKRPNMLVMMSNNISAPQNNQRWGFEPIAKIDDVKYSSVNLLGVTITTPGATASATASITSTASTTSTTSTASTASTANTTGTTSPSTPTSTAPGPPTTTGLSTGGKAGLGAALGVAAIIALVVLGFFYRKRRNQRKLPSNSAELACEPYQAQAQGREPVVEYYKHELDHDSSAVMHEMPSQTVTEVGGREIQKPAELMGDVERR